MKLLKNYDLSIFLIPLPFDVVYIFDYLIQQNS